MKHNSDLRQWVRTCQECNHKQEDTYCVNPTMSYLNRKCKKCHSMALDFGKWLRMEEIK